MAAVETAPPQFVITFYPNGQVTLQKVTSGSISGTTPGITLGTAVSTTNDIAPVHQLIDAEFSSQLAQELNS